MRLGLVFAAAVAIRLVFVLWYPQYPALIGDDDMYDDVAWHLASGHGFVGGVGGIRPAGEPPGPEVAIGPGYPAFLAAVYAVAGHSLTAARIVQALVGALLVPLCYSLGRGLGGRRVGLVAAALVAVVPALVVYTGMLLMETLFAVLLAAAIASAVAALRRDSAGLACCAGLMTALAVLTREEVMLLAPVALVVMWRYAAQWRRMCGAYLLAFVALVGCWTARNFVVFGEIIPVSANGGQALWISTMGWNEWRREDPAYQRVAGGLSYTERNRVLFREGVRNILRDPAGYLRLCARRVAPFWVGSHTTYVAGLSDSFGAYVQGGQRARVALKAGFLTFHLGLLAAAVAGATLLWRRRDVRPVLLLTIAPIATIATVHVFLFSTSRYQVPILPFLAVLAAAAPGELFANPGAARARIPASARIS